MDPVWLIEADVFGRSADALKGELRRQRLAWEIVHPRPITNSVAPTVAGRRLKPGDCVVFTGTWPLMRHIQLHSGWIPGGWCDADQFDCTTYYRHFKSWLLNAECRVGTIEELLADVDGVFEQFALDGRVFARPTPMQKIFTGRLMDRTEFSDALHSARYAQCQVLVARPTQIRREWRLVVSDQQVLAACQYREDGDLCVQRGCAAAVSEFAKDVLAVVPWTPDPIFMFDICESRDELRLLELNSFSCSGLYDCDPKPIVSRVRELATEAWHSAAK